MKTKYIVSILFTLILLSGFLLRIYQIGNVPASPDWDEVALGYNAYSILLTGKDEYGKFMPVVLESFDDYKPALYAYLIIPFLTVFDLSVTAVRLPAVIFGTISLAAVFFIVRLLFPKGITYGKIRIHENALSLVAMLLLALSPWHIQFSRVGFEAQIGLSFNLLTILFFLKSFKKRYFLVFSFFFAAMSIYVYQSEKVYMPLLLALLVISFFKDFRKISKKWIAVSFMTGLLIVIPMGLYILTNPNALSRAKGVSVFSNTTMLLESNTEKINRDRQNNDYLGLTLDNRRLEYVRAFTSGYLSHFEPNWLFYRGDALRHQPPYMGLLYIFQLPLILVGIYVLIFSQIPRRIKAFLVGYILIAPLPASVTFDVPHAVRTIAVLPMPELLSAIGLLYLVGYLLHIKTKLIGIRLSYLVIALCALFIFFNVVYYLNQYFVQMNYYYSKAWQYGWKEAVEYASTEGDKFDNVVVTNVSPLDQSYMFFLFYTKYDPKKYLAAGGTKAGGFAEKHTAFEKYVFRPIDWDKDKFMKNTLFIGRPGDLPDNIGKTVYYLNGEPAIVFSSRYE